MSQVILNFHDAVILAITFQSLAFVFLILFAKPERHKSDFYLAAFFLAQALVPLHILITYGDEVTGFAISLSPNLFHLFETAYWIEGALLLWFTRSLLYREFRLRRTDLVYLIPVALYLIYIWITFYSLSEADKLAYLSSYDDIKAPSPKHILQVTRETVIVAFCLACLSEILRAQKQTQERHANIRRVDFVWLSTLIASFMIARSWSLMVISISVIKPDLGDEVFDVMGLIGNYLLFVVINVLIFFSLARSGLVTDKAILDDKLDQGYKGKIDAELRCVIDKHMQENKPYRSHFLSLDSLSQQLSISPTKLSAALKQLYNSNFNEFVNHYRVEEAKLLLSDVNNRHRPELDILVEAGFNSRTIFNAYFKKLVGMSPRRFRRSSEEQHKKSGF